MDKLHQAFNSNHLQFANKIVEYVQPYLLYIGLAIFYLIYLGYCKYHQVIIEGNYNTKLKNIGKIIPPFPNGWYIVCKSEQLKTGESKAIDQSGQNFTLFRNSKTNQVYAIHSYCAHLGANLGIGGKVINDKCIQCPFHGWLYDGETGVCVDYNGKPTQTMNVQYQPDMGKQGCKEVQWIKGKEGSVKLRKYHVRQTHGFIYVWLHVDENKEPQYQFINVEQYQKKLSSRGYTKHTIKCLAQDIPENGADVFHFKYIHKHPIAGIDWLQFVWTPQWKAGDDPGLPQLFVHESKDIHEFKQGLYKNLIEPIKDKKYFSFANINNYVSLPFCKIFIFNLTVMQMGPGLVYVFLKTHFFTTLFIQYLRTQEPTKQILYHEMFSSGYLPYWLTSLMLRGEGVQVSNDMYVWDAKKFAHHIHYRDCQADRFVLEWRKWFSRYYEGCKQKKNRELIDW